MKTLLQVLLTLALVGGLTAAQARSMHHPSMRHHPMPRHLPYRGHHFPLIHHPGVFVHHGIYTAPTHHP